MTLDQLSGKGLLNRIQQQRPIRRSRNPLPVYGGHQRTHSGVHQLRFFAQFHLSVGSIAGCCCWRSVGNADNQQEVQVVGPKPLFKVTRGQDHFARTADEFSNLRTPQTRLKAAGAQQPADDLVVLHRAARFFDRSKAYAATLIDWFLLIGG
jgi:hypothetical protein